MVVRWLWTRRPTQGEDSELEFGLNLKLETSSVPRIFFPRPTRVEDTDRGMAPLSVSGNSEVLGSSPEHELLVIT